MNKSFQKYYSVLKMSWIQTLEYRANAVVGAFAILSGLLIEYLLLSQVFSDEIQTNSPIRSFASFNHLIIYIMLCMMVGQLKSSWYNSMMMIDEIRSGELNRYLIKPIPGENSLKMRFYVRAEESEEDFQMTLDFVEEFHDVIYEILTCSVFSIWYPLKAQWESEGEYLNYYSPVVWDTKYCTTVQRMERINRIEKLFDKLGLQYNTYHRGLMVEQYDEYLKINKSNTDVFKRINNL